MDLSELTYSVTLNISFLAALIAGIFYLVGWIISDTKIQDVSKIAMQFEGLLFVSKFIVFPALIAYPIINYGWAHGIPFAPIVLIILTAFQLSMWVLMTYSIGAHAYLRKLGLEDYYEERVDGYLEENNLLWLDDLMRSTRGTTVTEYLLNFSHTAMGMSNRLFILLSASLLVSGGIIWIHYGLYPLTLLALWSIILVLNMALIYGYQNADYPKVEVFLSGEEFGHIEGRLIKTDEDFIYVREEGEIRRIPKNLLEMVGTPIIKEEDEAI